MLSLSVMGFFLILNGSVLGWCSATNTVLLGTNECSAVSSVDEHHCDDCEHHCPEEENEDKVPPCHQTFKIELEDFLITERLDSQWDHVDFEAPANEWHEMSIALTPYSRFTQKHWVPPPLRHRFCVYLL